MMKFAFGLIVGITLGAGGLYGYLHHEAERAMAQQAAFLTHIANGMECVRAHEGQSSEDIKRDCGNIPY
jgi:hypothetical protein